MKIKHLLLVLSSAVLLFASCGGDNTSTQSDLPVDTVPVPEDDFVYSTEQFADIKILRYKVPGFEELKDQQKELVYYLSQAALAGRDIMWDQNYKHNLCIRRTLENIVNSYSGDRNTEDYKNFMVYVKQVWFSNGIHHHYSNSKFIPVFSQDFFKSLVKNSDQKEFPVQKGESVDKLVARLIPIIFDPAVDAKKVNLDASVDMVKGSAVNFYEGVTQKEVEDFYAQMKPVDPGRPVSFGLNSKVVKENGKVAEKVWKVEGMYTAAIEKIVFWLEKASKIAENDEQKAALDKLIEYYKTGDLKTFDEYSILWVKDTSSVVDVVNGFIEVYDDPLGKKGSFESVVSVKDFEASKRISAIGNAAQWFEDNSPLMEEHKKKNVTGISAKVINVVAESGDASPSTAIGINLPNANWIRTEHGSKSVQLGNVVYAYQMAAKGAPLLQEFAFSPEEISRSEKFDAYADVLHTDMHEVIGHASGKINDGIGNPDETLKSYASTLEEARADLVALYYLLDEKLIKLGVMKTLEVGKAGYDDYIRNGLMVQLTRLKLGEHLEEAHMRNRQLVAAWVYEKGKSENVIEKKQKDGKTYFVVNDYSKLRTLFGDLLREIQRIKSEGDYNAGKNLVETYGVKVDPDIHKEVLDRYTKLNIPPYKGFINPQLRAVKNEYDKIINVEIEYPLSFSEQMLYYAREHSFLPTYN